MPGLDPKRADIVLGGALVLEQAFAFLGIEEMVVSDFALREGVLLDALRRRDKTSIGHLRDLRYESVMHVAAPVPGESEHAEHSTEPRVATVRTDQRSARPRRVLRGGARGGRLPGERRASRVARPPSPAQLLRDPELRHARRFHRRGDRADRQVARYHRKSAPKPTHAAFAALPDEAQHVSASWRDPAHRCRSRPHTHRGRARRDRPSDKQRW